MLLLLCSRMAGCVRYGMAWRARVNAVCHPAAARLLVQGPTAACPSSASKAQWQRKRSAARSPSLFLEERVVLA